MIDTQPMSAGHLGLLKGQGEQTAISSLWNLSLLSPRERASRISFSAVVLLVLTIGTVCMIDAVRLVGRVFPGFFVNERLVAANFGRPDWTGPQGGIKFPDKLRQANERDLHVARDLESVVSSIPIGESIHYVLERDGNQVETAIPTMPFSWTDLVLTFGPTLSAGMLYLFIAAVVYVLKPDTPVTWALVLSCLLMGTYQMLSFDVASTHRFVRATLLVYALVPAAALHLSLLFPERKAIVDRWRFIALCPYALSLVLGGTAFWLYPGPGFLVLYPWIRVYALISNVALLLAVLHAFFRSRSTLARQRAKVVLFGALLAFPIPAFINSLSFLGSTPGTIQVLNTFVGLPLILFPASIGFAIARHNLFDVDVYVKRTVGYIMMTACVAAGYFAIQTIVRTAVLDPLFGAAAEQVYPLLFALLTVFAFNPLSRVVQGVVDKLFYRKQYDYKATVADVSESLATLTDVQLFIEKVIQRIRGDLFVDRAGVILLDERSNISSTTFHGYRFGRDTAAPEDVSDPCLSPDDPLLALLAHEKKLITKYDVAEDPRYGTVRTTCGARFEYLGASLVLPLYYRQQFAGALALGYKKSGNFYTREEVELLQTLTAMTSTAIEHSREKGQKAVLMQLFSKHVSPQVAESLWEQREQFLQGGRPRSQGLVVTSMFTDLQGFSTISEKQDPEILMKWLNTYLEMMTTTVMEHDGVVDDFFGDGIKINFGVPIPRNSEEEIAGDASNAVSCALAMERKMIKLNSMMVAQGYHPLRMRIGIYTGSVVAGSLGSADRMKYTTLGDTVNTAARLESFSKELDLPQLADRPCRILDRRFHPSVLGGTV